MKRLIAAALLLVLAPRPAPAQDAAAIAARASRTYRSANSLRARFHQVIEDRMIGTQESRGELVQSGQARLAMRFSDPEGDLIVMDGTYVWLYTPSTTPGQVIRTPIPTDPVYGPNVLARILDKPTERYEIQWVRADTVEGRAADVLEFVPTSADPLFLRAIIWLERQTLLPRRLELDERSGVHRTLTLSRIRLGASVARKEFVFDLPKGVRVIDR